MIALSKGFILCLLWGGRQMMSTWYSRAKIKTSRLLVCEQCPLSTKLTGFYFVGFVCLMKWRSHLLKISLSIHADGWHAWIDPGGVPFIRSCFIYFLVNTSNGGMKCPVGLIQMTNVTRHSRSADWTEGIWRLPFNPNIFACLCCTLVMPVSSQ